NTGADEAAHFLQIAGTNPQAGDPASPIRGDFMRPGYLLPVLDLEAGAGIRTPDQLAAMAVEFGQTIYNAKGIWPIVYASSSYAGDPDTSGNASGYIRPSVAQNMPNLWIARRSE